METNKGSTEQFLDALDQSVNSNTALLHFDINAPMSFDITSFLLMQLQTGYFHFTLFESDIFRGWENYATQTFSKTWNDRLIILQHPGTTWNGNTDLEITTIDFQLAKNLLTDLLTNEGTYFSKSTLGKSVSDTEAIRLIDQFIDELSLKDKRELSFFRIDPNFLWTIEECSNQDDKTKLGYFENDGRNFVLGILTKETDAFGDMLELKLLMTNGYS